MSQQISKSDFAKLYHLYHEHPEKYVTDVLGAVPWQKQIEIIESTFKHKYTAVKTCNAVGKGLPLDTPIATPTGWTTMNDLKPGDKVFNQYGKPVPVVATHPTKHIDCYKLSFDNGTTIVCDKDHLWTTLTLANRHRLKSRKTWYKQQLPDWRDYWAEAETLPITDMILSRTDRGLNNYIIPTARPLELPTRKYELHPYVFGAWLGDGTSIRTHITDPTYEIREFVERLGYETVVMNDPKNYNFWPKGDGVRLLKSLGVYGNKHIPLAYLRGSYEQRLDLLRGLMDADGHCTKQRGALELCLTDERLAKDACQLIASLGWKCTIRESDARLYGRYISKRYRITFTADVSPFRLKRKTEAWTVPRTQQSKNTCHVIKRIEKVDSVPTRCITVEGGIFLAGEQLIPTHNSYIAARIVLTYLMLHRNSIVVTTAPTWRQVTDILWREIGTAYKQARFKLSEAETIQAGLNINTNWYAVGLSTKRPENFFGYHADHILVVVDEAGGVEEPIFKGVAAITPNVNARVLLIGNPTTPTGTFYEAFTKPELGYNCFTISAFDSPNFTDAGIKTVEDLLALYTPRADIPQAEWTRRANEKLEKYLNPTYGSLIHPSVVYSRYHEWGADSPAWQALIMGEFPSEAEQALIPTDLVVQAMQMRGIDEDSGLTYAELSGWEIPDGPPEHGQDMARYGNDNCVNFPRHGGWVDDPIVWGKASLMDSADRILKIIDPADRSLRLNIDDTGNGGGTTDRLRQISNELVRAGHPAHLYQLFAYNFSSKEFMQQPDKFHDITAELYWNLRSWFIKKRIALPKNQRLFDELVGRRWWLNKSGKIQVESKDEYKKRTGGKSPDYSDALALAFAGGDRTAYTAAPTPSSISRREPTLRPITAGVTQRF